jgi:hypothetical protein
MELRKLVGALVVLPTIAMMVAPSAAAAEPELTLVFTDRTGAPAARADAMLVNLTDGRHVPITGDGGKAGVPASPGTYTVWSTVYTGEASASLLVWPRLEVSSSATLELDARLARPLEVRVPHRTARVVAAVISTDTTFEVDGEPRTTGALLTTGDAPVLSSAQLGPGTPVDGFSSQIKVSLAAPGDVRTSPYLYSLAWDRNGVMQTGLDEDVDADDVTKVDADYATLSGASEGQTGMFADGGAGVGVPIALPHQRTEYYDNDHKWETVLCYGPDAQSASCLQGVPGRRWNYAPFLPSAVLIERLEDRLRILPALPDQSGHQGLSLSGVHNGVITLYREGVKLGEAPLSEPGFADLPPEPAAYRVELSGSLSTLLPGAEFDAAWTFTSAYAELGEGRLPAMNVRFTPRLSADNHAHAGQPLVLPIEVSGGSVASLAVDVSYDAGATWRPARVRTARAGWSTEITPPVGAEDISLRAYVTDASGNTAMQSMTRAIPLD